MPDRRPWTYNVAKWHTFAFSLMFILYGGVKIILAVLDHQYDDLTTPFVFLLVGFALLIVSYAFRDAKVWSWYGLVGLNGLIVILALFRLGDVLNAVIMVVSLFVLVTLFSPQTKAQLFGTG